MLNINQVGSPRYLYPILHRNDNNRPGLFQYLLAETGIDYAREQPTAYWINASGANYSPNEGQGGHSVIYGTPEWMGETQTLSAPPLQRFTLHLGYYYRPSGSLPDSALFAAALKEYIEARTNHWLRCPTMGGPHIRDGELGAGTLKLVNLSANVRQEWRLIMNSWELQVVR